MATDEPGAGTTAGTDGRLDPGFDEVALYGVVRKAVEDAILGAVGTILLVGVAFVLVVVGATAAFRTPSPAGVASGVGVSLLGLYLASSTLGLVPPMREWI
ncbi:MAG: hypothetical protein ABEJ92_04285 [Halobacteriales archaeon]